MYVARQASLPLDFIFTARQIKFNNALATNHFTCFNTSLPQSLQFCKESVLVVRVSGSLSNIRLEDVCSHLNPL